MYVSACERKGIVSAASAFSVLVWSTLPLPPVCVHGSQQSIHPTVAGDKCSILPSHHWVWKSWSPLIFFFPVFLMTSSLWWSEAIFLLKDDYFGDPVMLFTTKVSLEAFSSYTLMSSDACFFVCLAFCILLTPQFVSCVWWSLAHPRVNLWTWFLFAPLTSCVACICQRLSFWERCRSGCWMLYTFQFRRCIYVSALPCFMSLCMSSITQAELKLNSLELHDAYSKKKMFQVPRWIWSIDLHGREVRGSKEAKILDF